MRDHLSAAASVLDLSVGGAYHEAAEGREGQRVVPSLRHWHDQEASEFGVAVPSQIVGPGQADFKKIDKRSLIVCFNSKIFFIELSL